MQIILFIRANAPKYFLALLFLITVAQLKGQKIDVYSRPVQVERSHDYDALNYRADLSFDMENKVIHGMNEIKIRSLRNGLNSCLMDAGTNLTIKNVFNRTGSELYYKHEGDKLSIDFLKSFNYGDTVFFVVEYSGVDPEDGRKIFYDKTEQHPAMICGRNFPNKVRTWLPCYDFPNDKATHEMIIHAPAGFKAVSNGILVSNDPDIDTGTSVWHWKMDLPHSTYLYVLAVAPYIVFTDSLNSLPVNYWVFPQDSLSALPAFSRTPEIIRFFNELFDFKYPWAKCDQVMIPTMGGASESTTATLYSNSLIVNLDEKGLKDYSFDWIIAHETAHHWWGDIITLRTWSETWLNESFGTYCDYIWTNRTKGAHEGAIDLELKKDKYFNEVRTKYLRPIVFNRYENSLPGQNFDRHTYQKGALMLHLLRSILGDDLFFRTISYFLHKHAFEPVDTYDFMKAIKEVTGQNMDWFFEQFFFKPGHPVFEVSKKWNEADKTLLLKIVQTQDTIHGVPYAFSMPVNIGLYTSNEKAIKNLWLDEREEIFEFLLNEEPKMVKFDNDNILLKELSYTQSTDELLFKLLYDDVIGRAEAAGKLSLKKKGEQLIQALVRAIENDKSWYVRKAALESLAGIGTENIVELSKKMAEDSHSQVRISAIRILGNTNDNDLVRFFMKRFNNDDSYMVQAECIISIGKCGSLTDIDFIKKAGKITSPRNVLANAAKKSVDNLHEE